ncbi:TerB N-terminal domain-containing protein [Paraburkholderia youngii]|uniref:tellurite resistance TerB family protein n=1 Tax=Paraburkholderia youngii TaxID=2782701 RepID=UPI003D25B293
MKFSFSSLYRRSPDQTEATSEEPQVDLVPVVAGTAAHSSSSADARATSDELVSIHRGQAQLPIHDGATIDARPSSFAIPRPTMDAARLSERWLPPGVSVNIGGTTIEGGMLYVGERVRTADFRDPSAISQSLEVAYAGDYSIPIPGFYPSYAQITPSQRRAYLNWLAAGRCDPNAAISFVFLYFYALERRVITDGTADIEARGDFPAIEKEVRRLLTLYGRNSSFKGYATRLLSAMEVIAPAVPPYKTDSVPMLFAHDEDAYLRWAFACCAADEAPLPARLALAYLSARRTPKALKRHRAVYTALFLSAYDEAFPDGLMLTQAKRMVELPFKAASNGLAGGYASRWPIAGLPLCGNEESTFEWLLDVGKQASAQMAAYVKAVDTSRSQLDAESLFAILLLPRHAWPASYARRFEMLATNVAPGFPLMSLGELRRMLRIDGELSRAQVAALTDVLGEHQIGLEPSIADLSKVPRDDDVFVLFSDDKTPLEDLGIPTVAPHVARLVLHIAYTVSALGSDIDAALERMDSVVARWPGLEPTFRARLRAYLRIVHTEPKATTKLATRLADIDETTRAAMAPRVAALAIGDGPANAAQVKALTQIYRTLGADPAEAILDLHRLGATDTPAGSKAREIAESAESAPAFRLDAARVASLQRDTEKTTALLADIFVDEDEPAPAKANAPVPGTAAALVGPDATSAHSNHASDSGPLPGLDTPHARFATFLLSRAQWSRDELLAAAAEQDLLLDGALEVINDAAFDHLDMPFSEGEDPVQINPELAERLAP